MKALLACVAVVAIATAVVAQQNSGPDVVQRPARFIEVEPTSKFIIIDSQPKGVTILLDQTTADTWQLKDMNGQLSWVAMRRITIKDGPGFMLPGGDDNARNRGPLPGK